MTLLNPVAAKTRAREKRQNLLRFLRVNKWTNQDNARLLLGLKSRQAAHKTLCQLAGNGLIKKHSIELYSGARLSIWGITVHGIMLSFAEHEPIRDVRAFEISKLSLSQIPHHLGLQQIQIQLEAAGWTGWTREVRKNKNSVVPDALIMHPKGWPIAIEYERSSKALRRYETILVGHLRSRKSGQYREVYYVAPDDAFRDRLMRIFRSIKCIRYKGETIRITPDLLLPFHFYSLNSLFEALKS